MISPYVVYLYTPLCQLYALLRVSFIALYLQIGICKIVPPKGKVFLVLRLSTSPVTHDVKFIWYGCGYLSLN